MSDDNDQQEKPPGRGWTPVPDPTVLTTEALLRAIASERDYVDGQIAVLVERLRGMDRATDLLAEGLRAVPTDVQQAVDNLRALSDERLRALRDVADERFGGIANQFHERDTRGEREARDNKTAVDAAFAASKEAAAKQQEANSLAITKSEVSTSETINKLAELFKSTTDGLGANTGDLKDRVSRIESLKVGGRETLTGLYAMAGLIFTAILAFIALAASGVFK